MYCPVDGMEYREGITRCPQHDVELVDDPPEIDDDPSFLEGIGADGAMRRGFRVVVGAAVVYAVAGVLVSGWFALAQRRQWVPNGVLDALGFATGAARSVLLAALACIAAAVLVRAFTRLGSPESPRELEDADPDFGGRTAWVVTLLTSLTVAFVAVWAVTGVVIAWDEADRGAAGLARFAPGESAALTNVMALHNAAYACGFGALVTLGTLLMARAYDRLAGIR